MIGAEVAVISGGNPKNKLGGSHKRGVNHHKRGVVAISSEVVLVRSGGIYF